MKRIGLVGISLLAVLLMACQQKATEKKETTEGLNIVTTFYPMYNFTEKVVGDKGTISVLIDGEEPHDYEPSAKDVARIEEADIFIYNSVDMETWVESVLKNIDKTKTKVIMASEGIELLAGDEEEHHHHHHGEESHDDSEHKEEGEMTLHLHGLADHYHTGDKVSLEAHGPENSDVASYQWSIKEEGMTDFSPVSGETKATYSFELAKAKELTVARLDKTGKVIDQTDPIQLVIDDHHGGEEEHHEGHHHEFDPHVWLDPILVKQEVATIAAGLSEVDPSNSATYEKNSLAFQEELESLHQEYLSAFKEAKNRTFVTQHTAFAYLAKRYELTQLGISGLSPDLEPTPKELSETQKFVEEHDVKVIFTEEMSSPKIAQTVADTTGAKLEVLNPLENLSPANKQDKLDYLGVMEQNLKALKLVIK